MSERASGGSSQERCATVNMPATQSSTAGRRWLRSAGVRDPELSPRLCQRPLRPGEPGRGGALLDAEMHGCLGDGQPAHDAQCQDHPGAWRQRLVACDEEQGDSVVEVVRQVVGGFVCGHRFSGCQLRRDPREDSASTVVVDPGSLRDAHAPCGEVVDMFLVHSSGERLGGVLLGVVEAARPRRQCSYDAWPGGLELLVGQPHDPMVAAGDERIIPRWGRPCATRWCRRWARERRPCGPSPRPPPRRRRSR